MAISLDVQNLAAHAEMDAKPLAKLVRDLKEAAPRYGFLGGSREALAALRKVNDYLGYYGIKSIQSDSGKWAAYYADAGDPYKATIMLQTHPRVSVLVGRDWGSYIERYDP